MHVEFKLPSGAGGQAAHYSCSVLRRELERWYSLYGFQYDIEVTYYKLSVRFDDDEAYTLFALSWICPQVKWQIKPD